MKLSLIFILFIVNFHQVPGSNDQGPVLGINTGTIRGLSVNFRGLTIYQFLGIPFAEPPLNDLRFKKPIPKKPWNGTINVDKWLPYCRQFILVNPNSTSTEDCLKLNVFVTQSTFEERQCGRKKLRPVLVWIHGGAFAFGSANVPELYDGSALAGLYDVIVVSINYRIGSLGFLHIPEAGVPGNMGLWDQQLAMKWIKTNIKQFGGNPDRVTIFGESAGSMSVSAHIISPQSKGLFKNAILQSGVIYDIDRWTVDDLVPKFLRGIRCKPGDHIPTCLSSYQPGISKVVDDLSFWPIYGDEFLPQRPEEVVANGGVDPKINILMGTVANEGALLLLQQDYITFNPINPSKLTLNHTKYIIDKLFGQSTLPFYTEKYLADTKSGDTDKLRLAVTQAYGDTIITCPSYNFGRDLVESGFTNLYAYYQSQRSSQSVVPTASLSKWLPPSHTDDIPMVFGLPFLFPSRRTIEDTILSTIMMRTWTSFAEQGKPAFFDGRRWTSWSNQTYPIVVLNSNEIGMLETHSIKFCFNNSPYPFEKQYPYTIKPGAFSKW